MRVPGDSKFEDGMKLFRCQACETIVYFENRVCGRCGHRLAYAPELGVVTALDPAGGDAWTPLAGDRAPRRFCANADYDVCNWLTPPESPQNHLCDGCRHNDTIPDISQPAHLVAWRDIELAKHRLFYSLLRWKLAAQDAALEDPRHGLAFEFLADPPDPNGPKVMTGHDEGVVTIALAEADAAEIEKRRAEMARALPHAARPFPPRGRASFLGHPGARRRPARGHAGRCSATTGRTMRRRSSAITQQGAPADWQERFVSAYATAHPWEDFAETWAHYLHIVDTLETASAFRAQDQAVLRQGAAHASARLDFDPYVEAGPSTRSSRPGCRSSSP